VANVRDDPDYWIEKFRGKRLDLRLWRQLGPVERARIKAEIYRRALERRLGLGDVAGMFRQGLISRDEARDMLKRLGYRGDELLDEK